jgi:hypothetical protein
MRKSACHTFEAEHRDSHGIRTGRDTQTVPNTRTVSTRTPIALEGPAAVRLHPRRVRLVNRDYRQCRDDPRQPVVPPFAAHGSTSVGIGSATPSRSSSCSESIDLARRSR